MANNKYNGDNVSAMAYLPEHGHCKYCGNPTKYGTDYCDDDCKELYDAQEAEEKKKDFIFYGVIAVSLVAIFIFGFVVRTYF